MSISEEKLAGVDQALADLGKSDDEISAVTSRLASSGPADLAAVDAELDALADGVTIEVPPASSAAPLDFEHTEADEIDSQEHWDDEHTEVETLDESDFVLLVDEDDLEELEKVGEEDAQRSLPPEIPRDGDEEGDGFFKKLFSGRRSRPPQQ